MCIIPHWIQFIHKLLFTSQPPMQGVPCDDLPEIRLFRPSSFPPGNIWMEGQTKCARSRVRRSSSSGMMFQSPPAPSSPPAPCESVSPWCERLLLEKSWKATFGSWFELMTSRTSCYISHFAVQHLDLAIFSPASCSQAPEQPHDLQSRVAPCQSRHKGPVILPPPQFFDLTSPAHQNSWIALTRTSPPHQRGGCTGRGKNASLPEKASVWPSWRVPKVSEVSILGGGGENTIPLPPAIREGSKGMLLPHTFLAKPASQILPRL